MHKLRFPVYTVDMATLEPIPENQIRTVEARMRRTLGRRGLALKKSRRRDSYALDYGKYWILDARRDVILTDEGTLEDIVYWVDNNKVSALD